MLECVTICRSSKHRSENAGVSATHGSCHGLLRFEARAAAGVRWPTDRAGSPSCADEDHALKLRRVGDQVHRR